MNDLGEVEKTFVALEERPLSKVIGGYTYFADDDVLVAKITPCFENGKMGIATNLTNGVGFGSSEYVVLRSKGKIDPEYLFYFLSRDEFREAGARIMSGAVGHKRVPKEYFEDLPIPLPPLEEQKRIVAVLDEAFEGLARARVNAEVNLQNARELFDSHLTNVFSHPGEGWRPAALGSLCKRITVGHVGPMANRYVDNGVPFLRSQNVRPFRIDLNDVKFIDDAFMSELKKSELRPGDVAIVRTGYPGTCAVIPEDLELANCADLVIARPGPDLNPHFLAMILNSSYGKAHVAGASVGAAQKHFNVGAAKSALFPIPPLKIQEALVERSAALRGCSEEIANLIAYKLNAFEQLKQSLLQKAFAGELT